MYVAGRPRGSERDESRAAPRAWHARGVAVPLEIVVVSYRAPEALRATLDALARHACDVPVTLVETGPAATWTASPHARLRRVRAPNHSYAHAVNVGLRATAAPLVATMNADVVIGPDTLTRLAAAFGDPRVVAAGPVARTPGGTVQDQGWPYRRHHARLRRAIARRGAARAWVSVPWLSGCLLVVRREALARVGGMDPRLRFYNEDLEWCRRLRAAGGRCALVATEVVHLGGAATPRDPRFQFEGLRGGYQLTRRSAPPIVRWLHRWGVAAVAAVAARAVGDPRSRASWAEVARRFAANDLDDSPFGPTLDGPLEAEAEAPAARLRTGRSGAAPLSPPPRARAGR